MSGLSPTRPTTFAQARITYFTIIYAFVISVLLYCPLSFYLEQGRTSHPAPPPSQIFAVLDSIVAVCLLVAAVNYFYWRTRGKIGDSSNPADLMPLEQFQTETLRAMGIAEACAMLGLLLFFCGAKFSTFVPFAAGTVIVDVCFVLPRGITYWKAAQRLHEQQPTLKG